MSQVRGTYAELASAYRADEDRKNRPVCPQVGAAGIQHGNADPCPKHVEGFCVGKASLGTLGCCWFVSMAEGRSSGHICPS